MPKKNSKSLYLVALALFVLGVGYLVFSGLSQSTVYYIDVAEALAMPPDKPQSVRLFGAVNADGLAKLEDGVGVRFQLVDKNNTSESLWIVYRGSVPDSFVPGAHVIVEGTYTGALHDFKATKLMTQCPSKYKKKEEQSLKS